MENKLFPKLGLSSTIVILTASTLSTSVFAWGSATHTYFAKELGNKHGVMNRQEMYGSVLPDMFNLMFDYPYRDYLYSETHYNFMKVVDIATSGESKAFVYGFASHNQKWGTDYTAHISAATNPGEGYVVRKRKILAPLLEPEIEEFLAVNAISYTPEFVEELALEVADCSIEFAVDLLVSQNEDKSIGGQMLTAAKFRSSSVPGLLTSAYAGGLAEQAGIPYSEAAAIVTATEKEFKEYMELYGGILIQENAADLMAELGAELAETILEKKYGIEVDVPPELVKTSLLEALELVEDDYSAELAASLDYIEEQLQVHGIETHYEPEEREFSLSQNYPNPCSLETAIEYSLAESCHVTLKVYNLAGQLVKTLINEYQQAGFYKITWHGDNDAGKEVASGVYLYQIKAGGFVFTNKMAVLK